MKARIELLILFFILRTAATALAQDLCSGHTEKIVGPKGGNYAIPCKDMVIMDITTYSKYRYMEKQFHAMDSIVSGYTSRIDSLDKENNSNKALLEEKIKDKEEAIEKYKRHAYDVTAVLEKCKTDSEGFVTVYQEQLEKNKALDGQVRKLRRQRKGLFGITVGLSGVLLLIVL